MAPAIHSAIRIAEATLRSLRRSKSLSPIPKNPGDWRATLAPKGEKVELGDLLENLWGRGIPVIPAEELPSPKFQGLACLVQDRPVIVLGHQIDAPPRLSFLISHEAGHIANGDCTPDGPIVDEDDEVADPATMERQADVYARSALGVNFVFEAKSPHPKEIARQADQLEAERGIDAGLLVWSWANLTSRFQDAHLALAALRLDKGGRRTLRDQFHKHVDVGSATETDKGLLSCVTRSVESNAAAG